MTGLFVLSMLIIALLVCRIVFLSTENTLMEHTVSMLTKENNELSEYFSYEVHQLRTENGVHFAPSSVIAYCKHESDANRIVASLNKDDNENELFSFGVMKKK